MDKKILISNLYGPYNLGDNAIRNSALSIINEAFPKSRFFLLAERKENFLLHISSKGNFEIEYSPYGFAIHADQKTKTKFTKIIRLNKIIFTSIMYMLLGKPPKKGFYRYIKLIKEADLVILMGGGYFVSLDPFNDFFGTLLNIIPLSVAKFYKKKIVILPISFGPFAHKSHEMLTGNAIKNTVVIARDNLSLSFIKKYEESVSYMPDMALYDAELKRQIVRKNFYVLTVRECLSQKQQQQFEENIVAVIKALWKEKHIPCVFIPMAFNPIEENDLVVAERLNDKIHDDEIFSVAHPKSPDEARDILRKAKFAICTRMHSAILATNVYTPFICSAYQHKINGFLKDFQLSDWLVTIDSNLKKNLVKKVDSLLLPRNYKKFITILETKNKEMIASRKVMKAYLRLV